MGRGLSQMVYCHSQNNYLVYGIVNRIDMGFDNKKILGGVMKQTQMQRLANYLLINWGGFNPTEETTVDVVIKLLEDYKHIIDDPLDWKQYDDAHIESADYFEEWDDIDEGEFDV